MESKRVELVAGADLLPSQREDFKQRWGVEAVYADVSEMLAKEKPDFVSITTQHHERAEVILACAEAGVKIIYPTKPVCLTLAEGDQVIRKCQDLGALLAVPPDCRHGRLDRRQERISRIRNVAALADRRNARNDLGL